MTANTNSTANAKRITNDAGFSSPHPSEAHQRAAVKGEKKRKTMNGSHLDMEFDGKQWWIVKVTPAPGSFKRSNVL